ncbi:hypothetical protein Tdes44962_MAKER02488 [Teratosphaeria destructans]|uniref:Protein FAF1 n=1 Tax=Teratosphaeria destructans TaxID=418781 RepID=A0A9W7W2X7_9PEZI|nr:hypothetical protein Tdes44962_MAKER02488 [Teratosphaeria destructans]
MSRSLGKRKRRADVDGRVDENEGADEGDIRARFQRAFEAKFKPLELQKPINSDQSEGDDESVRSVDDGSDWDGVSEDATTVEIVQHDSMNGRERETDRQEMKAFMSSKPPTAQVKVVQKRKQGNKDEEEDEGAESTNLKHDLALQRLLKESHLLDKSSFDNATPMPEGKSRLKALDLRLQDLGAKQAISVQDKMPLAHRKGIKAKAANREVSRRKEAAENGIILERARNVAKASSSRKRDRGIGAPSVGKFKGGTLKLSSRDVRSIEGPTKQKTGRGQGKGRSRR